MATLPTEVPEDLVFPARGESYATFNDKANTFAQRLAQEVAPTINENAAFINAQAGLTEGFASGALLSANSAESSAAIATSLVNLQGDWGSLSGSLSMPASTTHNGSLWVLAVNLADVTTSEPSNTNEDWIEVLSLETQIAISLGVEFNEVALTTSIGSTLVDVSFFYDKSTGKVYYSSNKISGDLSSVSADSGGLINVTAGGAQYVLSNIKNGAISEVSPINNDWNGYLDPSHTVQIEIEDTSAGTRSFAADTEIAPNLYVSAATDVTFSDTGISWLSGNSLYKLFDFTAEQLALIDVSTVPVYLKDQSGAEYFVSNATTGVTVSKPDTTTLKIEVDFSIFATLGITKTWRFFVTESVGRVVEISSLDASIRVNNGRINILDYGTYTGGTYNYPFNLTQNDFEEIIVIGSVSLTPPGRSGNIGIISQEQIKKNPTSFECVISTQAGESSRFSYSSINSFIVSTTGTSDSIKQVIGRLKRRV